VRLLILHFYSGLARFSFSYKAYHLNNSYVSISKNLSYLSTLWKRRTHNINQQLQSIIDTEAVNGWNYAGHNYGDYLQPGSSGCFGIGAKPDSIVHVGNVVFSKE